MASPYQDQPKDQWTDITNRLISEHPLSENIIAEVVLQSWSEIFDSRIGSFQIGKEIFPIPQMLSWLLHELIPRNFEKRDPGLYRIGHSKDEKDIVYVPENKYSIEIKGSSNPTQVFANRSYAQPQKGNEAKSKDGYFITINFQVFSEAVVTPRILRIGFGYIEHSDWIAQAAATGQQARLSTDTYRYKLRVIYPVRGEETDNPRLF